ncbi:PucR family transcriptional regulator [Clostridium lacusfryxellense]|uniref:PucR family transcriptional regulator n=1 Tax=Clostridium lacusfryxellense TaxID=205328 RepID=UPI001C0B995A|nr:PucR family transcriptional regulator [Clostridium lacusfryxellense]MBU3113226.1 PucR family transcriptional regulator [Clostridium lacusfryxellense]
MFLTCEDMVKLPHLEKIKLVAGSGGIKRIITWAHVVELDDVSEWVKGGELLFITGVFIKNDVDTLIKLLKDIEERNLSGLVINVGRYIKETPKEVIDLANSMNFPVFELPFEVKLIDVIQSICREIFNSRLKEESMNGFMREVIFGNEKITIETLNKAVIYGYNSKKCYHSLVVDIDNFKLYIKKNNIKDEKDIEELKILIQQLIDSVMYRHSKKTLYMIQSDSFINLVPMYKGKNNRDEIIIIAKEIKLEIKERIKGLTVSIGLGGGTTEIKYFSKIVFSAQKALDISKRNSKIDFVSDYKKTGVYRLFFDMSNYDEMRNLYQETLYKLEKYDLKNSSNLLETLEIYLEQQKNIGLAAECLYIHRNTMKYRINRIEEILGCNLKDDNIIFQITLCIKIKKFLNI